MSTSNSRPLTTAKYLFESLGNAVDADTFCKSIVHYLHPNHGAVAGFLTRLNKEAKIRWVGRYGYEIDAANVATLSVWDPSASSKAILTGTSIAIANPAVYEKNYGSRHLELPNGKGLLVLPLQHQGQAIGSLGIGFGKEIDESLLEDENFVVLAMGASAFLMNLGYRIESTSGDTEPLDDARITSRDIQILNLMDEGLTHYQIGRVLNLSESSIKQTASLLYRKLGVSKKLDAIDQAKLLRLI